LGKGDNQRGSRPKTRAPYYARAAAGTLSIVSMREAAVTLVDCYEKLLLMLTFANVGNKSRNLIPGNKIAKNISFLRLVLCNTYPEYSFNNNELYGVKKVRIFRKLFDALLATPAMVRLFRD
jgi:hypothetical protein